MAKYSRKEDKFWLNHYQCWKKSNFQQKDYCSSVGISIHVFRARVGILKKTAKLMNQSRFLPVPTEKLSQINRTSSNITRSPGLKLHFSGKVHLEIPDGFSAETLRKVIQVLEVG